MAGGAAQACYLDRRPLKAKGYIPILQDAHFKHADFMMAMDAALATGARVLALLSREYLASQHCMKDPRAA